MSGEKKRGGPVITLTGSLIFLCGYVVLFTNTPYAILDVLFGLFAGR